MDKANKTPFGVTPDGTRVELYTLTAGEMSCEIITYGGAARSLRLPDRSGAVVDVLLGYDSLEDYLRHDKYLGALIGRYANRIGGAAFELKGRRYALAANDGPNHLHGGPQGFDKQVWTVEEASSDSLTLTLTSPDGQEGYPGTLDIRVRYRLDRDGLTIDYWAKSDKDTLCNLTNHAYFNLNGHDSGPILDQEIQIYADYFTPTDEGSIPDGGLQPVEGGPMDLRELTPIGKGIDRDYPQLSYAGGYDHNWVIRGEPGALRPAARAYSPKTGIVMEALTTQPGIQFYSGNYLDGGGPGKGGAPYAKRWAFCLETQRYPDSPNHANFPTSVLKAGEEYRETTVYRFSVKE